MEKPRKDPRARLGADGETAAAEFLRKAGYRILQQGYRTRMGEIDLIAEHEGMVIFIEVKARTGGRFGSPLEAVGHWKQSRMTRTAAAWLAGVGARAARGGRPAAVDPVCRFDVIGVTWDESGQPILEHVPDAFRG